MSEDQRTLEVESDHLLEDYENTFSDPRGKRVLWDLLSRCHLFASTFTTDALRSAFLEGERNIGLYLLTMTELSSQEGLKRLQAMKPVDPEIEEQQEE